MIKNCEIFFNKMFNTVFKVFTTMGVGIIACMPFIYPIMIDGKFEYNNL